jgi:diguanylate cyclase (GGDEF)-like protein
MDQPPSSTEIAMRAVIADDDPVVRMLIASAVRTLGMQVEEARDGVSAVASAQRTMPDLVLLDVEMPGMTGFQACAAIRAMPHGRDIPILIVTGLDDIDFIQRAFDVGATDFITKPIQAQLLQQRIQFQMRASRAFRDVRQTLADLAASQYRLGKSQDLAHLGDWEWRAESDQLALSPRAIRILDCAAAPPGSVRELLARCVHPDDRATVAKLLEEARQGQGECQFDHRLPEGDRVVHHYLEASHLVPGDEPSVAGTVQDITDRRRAEERIRELAFYDSLTGLPNRRVLEDRLERIVAFAAEKGTQVALLFLDLDRFKRINDTLGHTSGDQTLKVIAERLISSVRVGDHLARTPPAEAELQAAVSRFGGDEFAVVLTGLHEVQDAGRIARRLLRVVRQPIELSQGEVNVTCSIGIAVFPTDGADKDALFRNADLAMDHAKEEGRDNHQFFSASMNEVALERMQVERALGEALNHDGLVLHYQPQVETGTGRILGAEALVRMRGPDGELLPPGRFIDVAEESGLIVPLGDWVLHEACAQFARWRAEGWSDARIAVNVSTVQLRNRSFIASVERALSDAGLEPQSLELELTEGVFIEERGRALLRELRDRGIAIAIDDFGTGFSSLGYLNRLPVDVLKIDRSFIAEIDRGGGGIVAAIVAMAHELGCSVVAEGVETEAELDFLRAHGCDVLQGFHLGRPVEAEQFQWCDLAGTR